MHPLSNVVVAALALCATLLLMASPGRGRLAGDSGTVQAAEAAPDEPEAPRVDASHSDDPVRAPGNEALPVPVNEALLVRVQVTGPEGEAVEGASAVAFAGKTAPPIRAGGAAPGAPLELHVGGPGTYWLTAIAPGWSAAEPQSVTLDGSTPGAAVRLRVNHLTLVRGRVQASDGQPLSGTRFTLTPQLPATEAGSARARAWQHCEVALGGRTAADGSFLVCGAAPGVVYRLELTPAAAQPGTRLEFPDLEAGKGPFELRADRPASGLAR